MASVAEQFNSRTGSGIGFSGPTGVSRTFRVIIDDPEHDPRAVLFAEIPLGTPHPSDLVGDPGAEIAHWSDGTVADSATPIRREGPTSWIVRLDYARPVAGGISTDVPNGWRFSSSTYSENQRALEEIAELGEGERALTLIGPLEYKRDEDEPPTGVFTTQINATPTIPLKQHLTRRVTGFEVPLPAISIQLRRRLANWSMLANYSVVGHFVKKLNNDDYLQVPKGHLRFENIQIAEIEAKVEGQRTEGLAYDCTLTYAAAFKPFSPIQQVATFRDATTGAESVVLDGDGSKVVEEFRVALFRPFATIIAIVESA